jgi:hypothetical protein
MSNLPMNTEQVGCAAQVGRGVVLIGCPRHVGKSMSIDLFRFILRLRPDGEKIKESGERTSDYRTEQKLFNYKFKLLRAGSPLPRRSIPDNFLAYSPGITYDPKFTHPQRHILFELSCGELFGD